MKPLKLYRSIPVALLFALLFLRCWTLERVDPPCPVVTSLSDPGAPADSIVTINGQNFLAMCPEFHIVKIGDVAIPSENIIDVPNAQTLRFKVPRGIASGPVSVELTNAPECNTANSGPMFTYYYTATLVSKFFGNPPPAACTGSNCLNFPAGIEVDNEHNVWVADFNNHVVRKIGANGTINLTVGRLVQPGPGCSDDFISTFSLAPFFNPADVAFIPGEGVYVAEQTSTVIRNISLSGVSVKAGHCFDDGMPMDGTCMGGAKLSVPQQIVADGTSLFFIDNGSIRKIDGNCVVSTPVERNTSINYAVAIEVSHAITGKGPVFIADQSSNDRIKSIGIDESVTAVNYSPSLLVEPVALAIDSKGCIFIADRSTHKIYVIYPSFTTAPAKIVELAGSTQGYMDNVPGNIARFDTPSGLTLDEASGILYVSDSKNNVIRKIKID